MKRFSLLGLNLFFKFQPFAVIEQWTMARTYGVIFIGLDGCLVGGCLVFMHHRYCLSSFLFVSTILKIIQLDITLFIIFSYRPHFISPYHRHIVGSDSLLLFWLLASTISETLRVLSIFRLWDRRFVCKTERLPSIVGHSSYLKHVPHFSQPVLKFHWTTASKFLAEKWNLK